MQRVQPEIKKIQQKYKDDRTKQNEELLKYYQENKINPLAGCLPLILILPIGIAVLGTFRHPGIQYHIPRTGTFSKLYVNICGNAKIDPGACGVKIKAHPPQALKFLGMHLNLSAANVVPDGIVSALPYFVLLGLVILTGWYQVRQTQARQSKSGGAPANAQMQAVTKIMPIFFGVISYGFSAATTIYFLISNVWRIGQQHFVLNKMYEEEHGKPPPTGSVALKEGPEPPPPDAPGSANGRPGPTPGAARRKKKKRKR
jgi:YidC/Oxa1 family membrane protein insertase